MISLRSLISVLTALLLLISTQQMAAARGQPAPMGQAVVCIGGQAVTVTLDAQGQPIKGGGGAHICPDCVLHFSDTQQAPDIHPVDISLRPLAFGGYDAIQTGPMPAFYSLARGPPDSP